MRYLFVFLSVVMLSCAGDEEKAASGEEAGTVGKFFPRFPDQQFDFISLGEETEIIKSKLKENGYKLKPDQSNQYRNEAKEIEIIIPDQSVLNSFKVFLYKANEVAAYEEFVDFFSSSAKTKSISEEFSVFDFETLETDFSITIFQQPDFLRLNFELNSRH